MMCSSCVSCSRAVRTLRAGVLISVQDGCELSGGIRRLTWRRGLNSLCAVQCVGFSSLPARLSIHRSAGWTQTSGSSRPDSDTAETLNLIIYRISPEQNEEISFIKINEFDQSVNN